MVQAQRLPLGCQLVEGLGAKPDLSDCETGDLPFVVPAEFWVSFALCWMRFPALARRVFPLRRSGGSHSRDLRKLASQRNVFKAPRQYQESFPQETNQPGRTTLAWPDRIPPSEAQRDRSG